EDTERGDVAGECGGGHADREPGDGTEHDPAAADAVADCPRAEGTEHHADEGVGTERTRLRRAEGADLAGVRHEGGQDGAVDDEVVAVEEDGGGDDGEDSVDGAAVGGGLPDVGG